MKVAVYPHVLEIGGSQLNAIELAAGVREHGHQVVVVGQPGPLLGRMTELDLEFVELPAPGPRPSPRVARELARLVCRRGIDVVHGYEWTAGLEGYLAARSTGVASICTVMSMAVPSFLPTDQPLVVGTAQIAEHCRRKGRRTVHVIEPPVDLLHNQLVPQDAVDQFRLDQGVDPARHVVVAVTRFAAALKLEGLLTAIDTVARLARTTPFQLVLVGSGPEEAVVRRRAEQVNAELGERVVILTGELEDPRPAYAAAEIVLGMGGSALRAMAFGRPLVVQGERGFWRTLAPASLPDFLWAGWYGVGQDPATGEARLLEELLPLLEQQDLRAELGRFARTVVDPRFSLARAAALQAELYTAVGAGPGRRAVTWPGVHGAGRFVAYKAGRRLRRWTGVVATDDFNARPVAALRVPGSQRDQGAGAAEDGGPAGGTEQRSDSSTGLDLSAGHPAELAQ